MAIQKRLFVSHVITCQVCNDQIQLGWEPVFDKKAITKGTSPRAPELYEGPWSCKCKDTTATYDYVGGVLHVRNNTVEALVSSTMNHDKSEVQ